MKYRHQMIGIDGVAAGNDTANVDGSGFTKGILYAKGTAGGTVAFKVLPGDGNDYLVNSQGGTALTFNIPAGGLGAFQVELTGQDFRLEIGAQDLDEAWFEGIREIA